MVSNWYCRQGIGLELQCIWAQCLASFWFTFFISTKMCRKWTHITTSATMMLRVSIVGISTIIRWRGGGRCDRIVSVHLIKWISGRRRRRERYMISGRGRSYRGCHSHFFGHTSSRRRSSTSTWKAWYHSAPSSCSNWHHPCWWWCWRRRSSTMKVR